AIVIVDHLADEDQRAFNFSQEVERLRDPSHWLSLTHTEAHRLAAANGLRVEQEQIVALELDFDDWLNRGGADAQSRELVERALAVRPATAQSFVITTESRRRLRLRVWLARLARSM